MLTTSISFKKGKKYIIVNHKYIELFYTLGNKANNDENNKNTKNMREIKINFYLVRPRLVFLFGFLFLTVFPLLLLLLLLLIFTNVFAAITLSKSSLNCLDSF